MRIHFHLLLLIVFFLLGSNSLQADVNEKGCCIITQYLCTSYFENDEEGDTENVNTKSYAPEDGDAKCGVNPFSFCTDSYDLCSEYDYRKYEGGAVLEFVNKCSGVTPNIDNQCIISDNPLENSLMYGKEWYPGEKCEKQFDRGRKTIVFKCGEDAAEHKLRHELP